MTREAADPEGEEPWYGGGLRFECTQCGNCCSGPHGTVWLADEESARIAGRLHLDLDTFLRTKAVQINGRWSLAEIKNEYGHDCIFLDRSRADGRVTCSIYEDRPSQCRTWPFWAVNLRSPGAWQHAKHSTPCPGMNEGPKQTVVHPPPDHGP